ncbi:MAG: hypothetical protein HY097_09525 [Nitrospinae bacterium]|nr:hypothetical protein [Nitrospinota bacterium]
MRYAVRLIFAASIVLSLLIFVKILLTFTPVPELFNRGIETWQIILFCITLSLSFFAYLTLNPPIIRADNKTEGRRELPPDSLNDSDFLLVVSKEISAGEAKDFSGNNWGFFLFNILEKEIGYFSMVDVSKLDKEVIKDKRVIIFSKGTTEKLTEERKNILKEFLKKGGILLIEIPDSSISELTGIALSDKSEFARKIDWIEPELLSVSGIRSSDFNSMPLNTTIHSIEHKEHDVKTILKIDGKDAILERKVETGKVIILCFDLSFQIFSMKQGIPAANDYRVSIGLNKEIRGVQTSNMAINKEMKINLIPFADILERFIMDITLQDSNIPVWWYYPHKFKGASIISFDEDFYGDRLFDTVQSLELRVRAILLCRIVKYLQGQSKS